MILFCILVAAILFSAHVIYLARLLYSTIYLIVERLNRPKPPK